MKKCRLSAALLVLAMLAAMFVPMTVGAAAAEPGMLVDFTTAENVEAAGLGNKHFWSTAYDEETKSLKCTVVDKSELGDQHVFDGSDAYFSLNPVRDKLNLDTNKYMVIRMKNVSDMTKYRVLYNRVGNDGIKDYFFDIEANMTEFQNVIFDMGATFGEDWSGTASEFRLDGLKDADHQVTLGATYYIEWIAFFADKEAAEAYQGPHAAPGYVADFTTQAAYDAQSVGTGNFCTVTFADNALHMQARETGEMDGGNGTDAYVKFSAIDGKLDTDKYKYMVLRLKNPSAKSDVFRFLYQTPSSGLGADDLLLPIQAGVDEYKTYVYNMSEIAKAWTGTLNQCRLDGTRYRFEVASTMPVNSSCDIRWIAFFETEEAAKAYKGPASEDTSYNEQVAQEEADKNDPNKLHFVTLSFVKTNGEPGLDPHFDVVASIDGTQAKYVAIKYRLAAGTKAAPYGQIYADAAAEPPARIEYVADGEWHVAYASMESVANWNADMTKFRFDPLNGEGDKQVDLSDSIDIAWIAFTGTEPGADYDGKDAYLFFDSAAIAETAMTNGVNDMAGAEQKTETIQTGGGEDEPQSPTGDVNLAAMSLILVLAAAAVVVIRKRVSAF